MLNREQLYVVFAATVLAQPVLADSAEAWKAYQEGRNPFLEMGLLLTGTVVFFTLLAWLHRAIERRKARKKRERKGKK